MARQIRLLEIHRARPGDRRSFLAAEILLDEERHLRVRAILVGEHPVAHVLAARRPLQELAPEVPGQIRRSVRRLGIEAEGDDRRVVRVVAVAAHLVVQRRGRVVLVRRRVSLAGERARQLPEIVR